MNRRRLLIATGTALTVGGSLSLAGGSGDRDEPARAGSTPTEASTPDTADRYDTRLDAVEDLSLDPTGEQRIDDVLAPALDRASTVIEFPPGEYRFEDGFEIEGVRSLGLRGLGDEPSDVRFRTDASVARYFLRATGGRNLRIENVTFDSGREWAGSIGLFPVVEDGLIVRDVVFAGYNPTVNNGGIDNLAPAVTDPNGTGVVEGLVRTGPTDITTHQRFGNDKNHGCLYLDRRHRGTLYVRDSRIENTGTNSIYATHCPGDTRIENCVFRNNNLTAIRIGGNGSYVRNSRFAVDTERAHPDNRGSYVNPHGIIWETGPFGQTGGYVEGCEFHWRSAPRDASPIVWVDGSAGAMTIRDSLVVSNVDGVQPIRIDPPTDPRLGAVPDRPWEVRIEDVSVRGSAGGDWSAIEITGRDGSVVEDSSVDMGGPCDGIGFANATGCGVRGTTIDVTGTAIPTTNAEVDRSER